MNGIPIHLSTEPPSRNALFRISKKGKVSASSTPEEGKLFKAEVEYLMAYMAQIGRELEMEAIDYGMFEEDQTSLAFRFNRISGHLTLDINGVVASPPKTVKQLLEDLDG